ncbi:hypothetical protein STAQ_10200 [Allostella sp. ATCC 35155]|nr:hypothetical protein STAQ_10200 [Stella sp. ATCC 35155]
MYMNSKALLHATAATFALAVGINAAAAAQQSQQNAKQQTQQRNTGQVAQGCLNDLRAFNDRMRQDGFWLSGWGTYGNYVTGAMNRPGTTGAMNQPVTTAGRADSTATRAQRDDVNQRNTAMMTGRSPWGNAGWGISSPPYQIRTLRAAANVLGHRGDQDGCRQVLAELREIYGGYADQLRQAGVEPGQITSWRRERIVSARPVGEVTPNLINLGEVTGTEVRNLQDEELGTVEDLVLDPQSGNIHYVIVSSGGILGIGEDMVPVPWKSLRATPGMNTFVLDAPEQAIEDAPSVDVSEFSDPNRSVEDRKRVDQYWNDRSKG